MAQLMKFESVDGGKLFEWQQIDEHTEVMRVPRGWVVRSHAKNIELTKQAMSNGLGHVNQVWVPDLRV